MANIPKIRFKGFTEDWEQRKLGEICTSFEYGLNAAAKDYDGENKYIRITDIDDVTRTYLQNDITTPDFPLESADNYLLQEGDIVFARTGASVGKSYIYKEKDGKMYYAGFLIRARIKADYNAEFVFQNTLTSEYEKYIRITSQRSGQPGVNAQEYAEYELLTPKIEEQIQIGDFLRSLDNLITLHQRKCDELSELKKFMLQKMFPKANEQFPEIRFKGFTEAWEQRKLSKVGEIITGITPPTKDKDNYGGDKLFISPADIQGNRYVVQTITTLTDRGYALGKILRGGTSLFVSIGSTIGKVAQIKDSATTNQQINAVVPNDEMDDDFVFTLLENESDKIKKLSAQQAVPIINKTTFGEIEISFPKKAEQTKIGEYFSNLDNLIILHHRQLRDMQNTKKYMLQNMFV